VTSQRVFTADGPAGAHQIAYMDWGDRGNPNVLVCVHGLTRNSRDFDAVSQAMCEDYRVICVDIAGRGESSWLDDPEHYGYPQYVADTTALLAHLGCESIDWLGTSMGGILGMMMAAMPETPVKRLIINDIGPFIPNSALKRIAMYLNERPTFPSLDAFERYLRIIHASFGPLTDAEWEHLAKHSARQSGDDQQGKKWEFKYDPAIAIPFSAIADQDIDLWEIWDAISCPTYIIRGFDSDVFPADIAEQVRYRGPKAIVHQFEGIGHAPALMEEAQIRCIQSWLSG
jgi:pimeloyl-ACP methyl ester carboxylesterase